MASPDTVPPLYVSPSVLQQPPTPAPLPLASTSAATVAPPLAPSFQDVDDSDDSFSDDDDEQEAIFAAANEVFTPDQIEEMVHDLKERGLFAFVNKYVQVQKVPIPVLLLAFGVLLPAGAVSIQDQLRILRMACSRVLRHRERLEAYTTVQDALSLIRKSKKIMVLTGAGVSTSCGIPDFRSPTGLYARLKQEHWELEDPQEMFDLSYFKEKPNVFYSFAKEIYPSNFTPSPCHRFVRLLELNDKLLRNYTQNIDGLFEQVGVKRMLNCHGSFATASCLRCRTQFPGSAIEADVFAQRVPLCPLCSEQDKAAQALKEKEKESQKKKSKGKERWDSDDQDGEDEDDFGLGNEWTGKPLIKPDIVFFGEMLSDEFDHKLLNDREEVDLLIVIGTSLRVSPVAQIVSHIPHSVPQILINRDPIPHANFDIVLLGDGDTIIQYLCDNLDESFDLARVPVGGAKELEHKPRVVIKEPERVGESHVWLFEGAHGGRWVEMVRRAFESEDDHDDDSADEDEDSSQGLKVPVSSEGRSGSGSRSRTRSPSPVGGEADGINGQTKRTKLDTDTAAILDAGASLDLGGVP